MAMVSQCGFLHSKLFLPTLKRKNSMRGRVRVMTSLSDEEKHLSDCLQNLSDSLKLPSGFLKSLPNDLKVDVKDAAFALSKGPVYEECGTEVGNTLQQLSKAWEQWDTDSLAKIGKSFPKLQSSISKSSNGPAFGKRLISAGKRFKSTGQYAKGEFQDIARALTALGEAVGGKDAPVEDISSTPTTLKFGSLTLEITPRRAFAGSAVAFLFGLLSWQLGLGVQAVPESVFDFNNENAVSVATSLRFTLLAMAFSSAALSGFTSLGLVLLGLQISGDDKKSKSS